MDFTYKSIGTIYSEHNTPEGTPIQASVSRKEKGYIELKSEYVPGLKDLEGFSHIILLYHFHLSSGSPLLVKPFLDDLKRGVFATRAPRRPNPIGLSVVKLERIENNILHIEEVDIVNETPLLDIKPFVPPFDHRENCTIGWMEKNINNQGRHYADDRFTKNKSL